MGAQSQVLVVSFPLKRGKHAHKRTRKKEVDHEGYSEYWISTMIRGLLAIWPKPGLVHSRDGIDDSASSLCYRDLDSLPGGVWDD